jgi:Ribbon-helix-helix protein, copG family
MMAHLTIDITPELARQLQEEAGRRGLGVSEYVRLALEALVAPQNALPRDTTISRSEDVGESATAAPVSDEILTMVEAIWRDVPEEELAKLPPDFSANLDHYLYGAPKRT